MKSCLNRKHIVLGSVVASLFLVVGTGCSKAPDATQTQAAGTGEAQLTDSRITSIQNDPNMTPEQKQQAIATLKSRQQPSSAPASR